MIAASELTDRMASSATFAIILQREIDREKRGGLDRRKGERSIFLQLMNVIELTKNRLLQISSYTYGC